VTTATGFRSRVHDALPAVGAFFALSVAWMTVLPLFAGPDEPANFIKSAAVVRGELVGEPIAASATTSFWSTYVDIDPRFGTAQQVPWCFVGQSQVPACDNPLSTLTPVESSRTDMGRYPPVGFAPAGIGTFVGPTDLGVRAARATAALVACAMLATSIALLRRRGRSILPVVVATTPGVLFLSSVTSPSGLEIAAAITAWTAVWLAISERWGRASTVTIFVAAASVLVLSRPAGAVTVAVMMAAAVITEHRAVGSAVVHHWQRLSWLGLALALSGAWYLAVYDDNLGIELAVESRVTDASAVVSRTLSDLPRVIGESVGNFGWLDTPSPTFVIWAFVAMSASLAWRAFAGATRRGRLALVVVAVSIPLWHVALNLNYQELLGTFGAQGRHLTPFLVGLPLAAVMTRKTSGSDRTILGAFVVLHLWCVLVALRRYSLGAGGDDLFGFLRNPSWTPALGMVGAIIIVAVAHLAAWLGLRRYAGRMER